MLKNVINQFSILKNIDFQISKTVANWIIGILIFTGVVLIVWNANWRFGDDIQFLFTTASGKPIFTWFGSGRFFPLGLADYNILLFVPFGYTVTAHLIWNSVLWLICMVFLFNFLKEITNKDYFVCIVSIIILICSSAFLWVNMHLPAFENVICFMFSVFMFCAWKGEKKQSIKYYACALAATLYVVYVKEPVFGMIFIIAFTRLIFGFQTLTKKDRIFYYSIILAALSYIILYSYLWYQNPPESLYNVGRCELRGLKLALAQLHLEPILWVTLILGVVRAFFVVFKSDKTNLLVDSLLFAGGGYFLALWVLNLISNYYVVPCVFLSIPAFACFLHSLRRYNLLIFFGGFVLLLWPAYKDSHMAVLCAERTLRERREDMAAVSFLYEQSKLGKKIFSVILDTAKPDPVGSRSCNINYWNSFIKFLSKENKEVVNQVYNLDEVDDNTIIVFCLHGQERSDLLAHPKMKNFYLHSVVPAVDIYAPKVLLEHK